METGFSGQIAHRRERTLRVLAFLGVVLYFTALTLWMTFPLVLRMADDMVGQVGDNIYFVWMIGWVKKALFDLQVNPFDVWFLNYPEGWNMAYTEITPAQLALALPFSLLVNPVFAYNAAMMLTFILSGLMMYLWVRHFTGRWDAALIAGSIYAFLPYRFAHFLIGHLNLTGTQWLPLYFWGFLDVLRVGREVKAVQWKPVVLGGVGLGLIALTSQYYLYMALIVSALLFGIYLLFLDRFQLRNPWFWRHLLLLGLAALPMVLLAVAPFFRLMGQGGLPDRNISITRLYSASPTDFVLPSTDHFLWGKWIGEHFNRQMWVEGTLYVGVVSAALGLLALWKRRHIPNGRLVVLLFWGGLLAAILAMGIDFHWNGEPLEVATPAFLQKYIDRTSIPILLPGYFLFKYFPFYAKLRSLMRFAVFTLAFSSVVAGLGSAWLMERIQPRRRYLATLALLLLVCLDFYPGPYQQFARVEPRPVDIWLAQQADDGAVIQFPFSQSEDQEQTYYTLFHGKPFVGGFFNAFPPPQYSRVRPIFEHFPDAQSVALLGDLGAYYVLIDRDVYDESIRQRCEALGLMYETQLGDQLVFTYPLAKKTQ